MYALVQETLGNGRFRLGFGDGVERLGVLRGSMRRRVWVRRGDLVLAVLRSYQDAKSDVVHRYSEAEANRLESCGELSSSLLSLYKSGGLAAAAGDREGGDVVFDEDCEGIDTI